MQAQLLTCKCPHCGQPTDVDTALAAQTITCPNPSCQQPFKVEGAAAEAIPSVVISTGLAHEVVQEQPAATAGDQAAPAVETDLLSVHPMMFRRYPFRCVAYALLTVVGLGVLLAALVHVGWLLVGLLGGAMVGFGLYKLGGWWLRMLGTSVTVTTKRILLRIGAFHSQITEVPHTAITNIEVHQTLINRLMGVGDIAIVTNAQDKKGILLMGLPNPEDIAHHIRTRRAI